MPELPEVESVVRRLRAKLCGLEILSAQVFWKRSIACPKARIFSSELSKKKIQAIDRRGKYLVFTLFPEKFLLAHLRMSGDFIVEASQSKPHRHDRAIMHLKGGLSLRFNDTRKFGRLYLVKEKNEILGNLGPEPLDAQFDVEKLCVMLATKPQKIKTLLLDQKFIAGLGNIYVVESLWHARIHPLRKANSLNKNEVKALHAAIKKVLAQAINKAGTDIGDGVWQYGGYKTKAYGREGKKCLRCKTGIKRIVLAQRGTEFCPICQSSPRS